MKWVNIEKKGLPKRWGQYIVCLKNGTVMAMNFAEIPKPHWFVVGVGPMCENNFVTDWQPLPGRAKK